MEKKAIDCEACETVTLFGVAGTCDETNSSCICPPGYSGRDDWLQFDNCSVNDSMAYNFHVGLLIAAVLGYFLTFGSVFILVRRWRFHGCYFKPPRQTTQFPPGTGQHSGRINIRTTSSLALRQANKLSFFVPPMVAHGNVKLQLYDAVVREWRRKRASLIVAFLCHLSFTGAIMYHTAFLFGHIREDAFLLQNLGLYFMLSTAIASTSVQFLAWYYTLPSVTKYGALFEMDKLLIKYPSFFGHFAVGQSLLFAVLTLVFFLIIPQSAPDLQLLANRIIIILGVLYCIAYGILLVFITRVIEQIFRCTIQAFENSSKKSEKAGSKGVQTGQKQVSRAEIQILKTALATVGNYRAQSLFFDVLYSGLYVIFLITDFRYQYVFFNIAQVVLFLGLLPITFTLVFTDGGLAPSMKKKQRSEPKTQLDLNISSKSLMRNHELSDPSL